VNRLFVKTLQLLTPVSLILFLTMGTVFAATEADYNERRHDSGVMRIWLYDSKRILGSGTGFLLNRQGYMATNNHVVRKIIQGQAAGFVADGGIGAKKEHRKKFTIVWYSKDYDLAIIKVSGLSRSRTPLTLAEVESRRNRLKKGQGVWTSGFPGASDIFGRAVNPTRKDGTASSYRTAAIRRGGTKIRVLEHNATTNSGNSGGPVSDRCGRVVAVTFAKTRKSEGTFWAIRISELIDVLRRKGIKYNLDRTSCKPQATVVKIYKPTKIIKIEEKASIWAQIALAIGLLLVMAAIAYLWLRSRRMSPAEGMSAIIRREVSKIVKCRTAESTPEAPLSAAGQADETRAVGSVQASLHGRNRVNGIIVPLSEQAIVIGRAGDADCIIQIPEVGRHHIRVGWDRGAGQCWIEDLGSTNGTWLEDGTQVAANSRILLNDGAGFYLGVPEVAFRVLAKNKDK